MQHEYKSTSVPGAKMSVYHSGNPSGDPIVLMHGWGCNHSTLDSIAKALEPTCSVYNIDFPGFGNSPEPPSVWGVDDYANLVEQFLRKENILTPALLGHSFGGRVAIVMASRGDYSKMILVDAAGVKPRRSLKYYFKVYGYKLSKFITHLVFGKSKAKAIIERQAEKRGSADWKSASPHMRRIMSKVVNEDLRHLMPAVKCPTLLIWGECDTATPISDAHIMNKLIKGSGLVTFKGCGHYSFLDNPVQFRAVIQSFMNS